MSENIKNGNDQLPDFLRYKQNKMTDRERNAFERKLQKDPFTAEAYEGFEGIDPALAEKEVSELRKELKKRTGEKQRIIWYRIAASVAVLMILSAIFIITDKREEPEQLAYSPAEQKKEEIQILREEPVREILEYAAMPAEDKQKGAGDQESSAPPAGAAVAELKYDKKIETREEKVITEQQEAVMAAEPVKPVKVDAAEKAMPSKSARTIKTSDTVTELKPDTSDINLNEVVVVGYGGRNQNDEAVDEYIPPLPVIGRTAFDNYIRENIRRPDTTTSGQRVVVVLNFNVNPDGKIDSIKVVRSPAKIFSDEAIRLIREGPAWNPAEENGKTITDEVRVRIVFK